MNYYYRNKAGQEAGPVGRGILTQLLLAGEITPDTQVRRADETTWKSYQELNLTQEDRSVELAASIKAWRPSKKHYLGSACLVASAIVFFLVPFSYDAVVNSAPQIDRVRDDIMSTSELSRMPHEYLRAAPKISSFEVKFKTKGAQAQGEAQITLDFAEPLFVPYAFDSHAAGDQGEPSDFQSALDGSRSLPSNLRPHAPLKPNLFTRVEASQSTRRAAVEFDYSKVPRDWSLPACIEAWSHMSRDWRLNRATWSSPPRELIVVRTRAELPPNVLFVGEKSGDDALRIYRAEQKNFIRAVEAARIEEQWAGIEREVARLAGDTTSQLLTDYEIVHEVVLRDRPTLPLEGASAVIQGQIVVAQSLDLYRRASLQPDAWEEQTAFEQAVQVAKRHFPELSPPRPSEKVVYSLARAKGARRMEDFQASIRTEGNKVAVKSVQWSRPAASDTELVLSSKVGPEALFENDPTGTLPSTAEYRTALRRFITSVQARLEARKKALHADPKRNIADLLEQYGLPQQPQDYLRLLSGPSNGALEGAQPWRSDDGVLTGATPNGWKSTLKKYDSFLSVTFTAQTETFVESGRNRMMVYRSPSTDSRKTLNLGVRVPVGQKNTWTNEQYYANEVRSLQNGEKGELLHFIGPLKTQLGGCDALAFLGVTQQNGLRAFLWIGAVRGSEDFSVQSEITLESFMETIPSFVGLVASITVTGRVKTSHCGPGQNQPP